MTAQVLTKWANPNMELRNEGQETYKEKGRSREEECSQEGGLELGRL